MEKVPKFQDMRLKPVEIENVKPISSSEDCGEPIYPYGLCICLTATELEALGLSDDCEVSDILHGHFLATVKSVSKNATTSGSNTRVELQITHLSTESEDDENEESESKMPRGIKKDKMYK